MRYTLSLGPDRSLSFYYNQKIYDPHYSSIELAMLANTFLYDKPGVKLLDVATGCGFTGLILKALHPTLDVTLTDNDPEATRVAKLNAKRMGLAVDTTTTDLIPEDGKHYNIITANLPTFDDTQMAEEELHGPNPAYYGGPDGLVLYRDLLKKAAFKCDVLVCEVQKARQPSFQALAELSGWSIIANTDMAFALTKEQHDGNKIHQSTET